MKRILATLILSALPVFAAAQTYRVTPLASLPGTTFCTAFAINDSGVAVGYCAVSNLSYTATRWTNGAVTSLGLFPNGHYSDATAISPLGKIVGDGDMGDFQPKPFLLTSTGFLAIDTSGGSNIHALGVMDNGPIFGDFTSSGSGSVSAWTPVYWLEDPGHPGRYKRFNLPKYPTGDSKSNSAFLQQSNHLGQAVGYVSTSTIGTHGAVWNNDTAHSLIVLSNLPLAAWSQAYGINDFGQAVGTTNLPYSGSVNHAIFWDADAARTPTDLGTLPGDDQSDAAGINNAGQIIGTSRLGTGTPRAYVYQNGAMQDLASLVDPADGYWTIDRVSAINNAGQIVANGTSGGQSMAILLTPVVP